GSFELLSQFPAQVCPQITTRKLYYLKYCLAISSSLFWLTLTSSPTPSPLICVAPRGGGLPGNLLTYFHLGAWLHHRGNGCNGGWGCPDSLPSSLHSALSRPSKGGAKVVSLLINE
ncbi:hypothetical protein LEMLEM_LOCUS1133, partial [Lemmus lemmus]